MCQTPYKVPEQQKWGSRETTGRTVLWGSRLHKQTATQRQCSQFSTHGNRNERSLRVCFPAVGAPRTHGGIRCAHKPTREGAIRMPTFRQVNRDSGTKGQRDSGLDGAKCKAHAGDRGSAWRWRLALTGRARRSALWFRAARKSHSNAKASQELNFQNSTKYINRQWAKKSWSSFFSH